MAKYRSISKDSIYFRIPAFIIDFLIQIIVYEVVLRIMGPTLEAAQISDIDELFLVQARALLFASFAVSVWCVDYNFYKRKVSLWTVFFKTGVRTVVNAFLFMLLVSVQYKVVPRRFMLFNFAVDGMILCALHVAMTLVVRKIRKSGMNSIPVVIIGSDKNALNLSQELHYGLGINGYRVLGFFTDENNLPEQYSRLGGIKDVCDYLPDSPVSEVYCSLNPSLHTEQVNEIIKVCERNFISFYYVHDMGQYVGKNEVINHHNGVRTIKLVQ